LSAVYFIDDVTSVRGSFSRSSHHVKLLINVIIDARFDFQLAHAFKGMF